MRLIVRRLANYLPACAFAASYAVLTIHTRVDPLRHVDSGTKGAAYQTLAAIAAGVLGLGVVSFSVLFAVSPRSRLAAIVAYSPTLRAWLTGAFSALGIAMVGFGVLLPIDGSDAPTGARYVAVGLTGVVATALIELIYLADRTFQTLAKQIDIEQRQSTGEFPVIEPDDTNYKIPTTRTG